MFLDMVRKAIRHGVSDAQRSSYDEKNVRNALSPWSIEEIERELEAWMTIFLPRSCGDNFRLTTNSFEVLKTLRFLYG